MQLLSHTKKLNDLGQYVGYACKVRNSAGKEVNVLADLPEHLSENGLRAGAYRAVRIQEKAFAKGLVAKAEEIMADVDENPAETPEEIPASESTPVKVDPMARAKEIMEEIAEKSKSIKDMNFFELKAYAKSQGIKVTKKTKKVQIIKELGKLEKAPVGDSDGGSEQSGRINE